MRVLLASHGSGPYGAERILLALADGLAGRGHEAVSLFPHDGPAAALARSRGLRTVIAHRPRLPRNVAEGLRFFAGLPGTVLDYEGRIRELEPDVVWANSLYASPAALAGRLARRPVVWHLHESNLPGPAGTAAAAVVRALADVVVTVSDYVAGTFGAAGRGARVLHNPLLATSTPAAHDAVTGPDEPFRLVCIGQLEPRKRVADVVAAAARVEGVVLTVVGDGKARARVEDTVRDAGVAGRVELVGYREEVRPYLTAADCVVIPAVREPFGLVALEALAADVAVVAAESGALPEVLGDAALFYGPGDVDGLVRRIEELRGDPARAEELRRRGRARLESFDREAWLDEVEEILRVARARRPGGRGT